jgi:hypothetical protein
MIERIKQARYVTHGENGTKNPMLQKKPKPGRPGDGKLQALAKRAAGLPGETIRESRF